MGATKKASRSISCPSATVGGFGEACGLALSQLVTSPLLSLGTHALAPKVSSHQLSLPDQYIPIMFRS